MPETLGGMELQDTVWMQGAPGAVPGTGAFVRQTSSNSRECGSREIFRLRGELWTIALDSDGWLAL